MLGKMEAGSDFEVIGTNVLANEVVRHFSILTAKECWESAFHAKLDGLKNFNF